jgi:hypothetical protein
MKKLFRYIEPMWLGNDKKVSLRSVAAIALIIDFIRNVHDSASIVVKVLNLIYTDKGVDSALIAAMSGNLAQIAIILAIEAALIAAMLALKTYSNNLPKMISNASFAPIQEEGS